MQRDDERQWITYLPTNRNKKNNSDSDREERTQREECKEAIDRYSQCS